jgi:hypothetical protein
VLLNFPDLKQICLVIFLWTSSRGLFVDWENELKITMEIPKWDGYKIYRYDRVCIGFGFWDLITRMKLYHFLRVELILD